MIIVLYIKEFVIHAYTYLGIHEPTFWNFCTKSFLNASVYTPLIENFKDLKLQEEAFGKDYINFSISTAVKRNCAYL